MGIREYLTSDEFAKCEIIVTNESSLSRVWRQTQEHDSGTISAYRSARDCGDGEKYTKSEKDRRNNILSAKLKSMGYGITKIKGTYIENYGSDNEIPVKEESFLVVDLSDKGTLKADLMKLGEMFEQDFITYNKKSGEYYLISTNRCPNGYPGFGKIGVEDRLGSSMFGEKGKFYSRVNGRPFIFESIQNRLTEILDHTPTEIRSVKHFSVQKVE